MKSVLKNITVFFLLVSVMLCMLLSGCTETSTDNANNSSESNFSQNEIKKENKLVDEFILDDVTIYSDYTVLPICDVISGLGFELTWENDDRATFYCNDIKYELSISEKTLTEYGEDYNYLICAPGNKNFYCDIVNKELLVDDNTVKCLFSTFMDYPISVTINREENCVVFTKS